MTRWYLILTALLCGLAAQAQNSGPVSAVSSLPEVRRIYVGELIGAEADALRELIIASLDATKLFVLTDNADRADAVLRGAADDKVFTDTLDIQEGISARQNSGKYGSGTSSYSKSGGGYGGLSISDQQSHHSKERKHEAYAAVRLCNKDGDVLWSTTQESSGAKFRGASADVAAKVARQLMFDVEKARRTGTVSPASGVRP
jgi:hypothetical protein